MSGVCTVGSIGIGVCPCHLTPVSYTTIFVSGAATVNANGSPVANLTSIGISSCGHPTVALTVSATVNANSSGAHRIGDLGSNCGSYTALTGSEDVISG